MAGDTPARSCQTLSSVTRATGATGREIATIYYGGASSRHIRTELLMADIRATSFYCTDPSLIDARHFRGPRYVDSVDQNESELSWFVPPIVIPLCLLLGVAVWALLGAAA